MKHKLLLITSMKEQSYKVRCVGVIRKWTGTSSGSEFSFEIADNVNTMRAEFVFSWSVFLVHLKRTELG